MNPRISTVAVAAVLLTPIGFAQNESTTNGTNVSQQAAGGGLQIGTRTDQERIDFLQQVASAYFDEKEYDQAISAYERILDIDPSNKEARFIIGHVYITAKQYGKAEAVLKQLIEEYPEDFQLKNNLAWLYATAEDPAFRDGEEAIKLAQEAMVLAPNDHHIWSTLSEAYYVTGQYEKAYRAIEHMAKLAMRYGGKNITKETVDGYNEQIMKCKRAWDSEKALKGEDEPGESEPESPAAAEAPAEDAPAAP